MKEDLILRANILGGIGAYIRDHVEDEEAYMRWITVGLPDEWDEEDILDVAADIDEWCEMVTFGTSLINIYK